MISREDLVYIEIIVQCRQYYFVARAKFVVETSDKNSVKFQCVVHLQANKYKKRKNFCELNFILRKILPKMKKFMKMLTIILILQIYIFACSEVDYVPETLYGLSLKQKLSGEKAKEYVNRLHIRRTYVKQQG